MRQLFLIAITTLTISVVNAKTNLANDGPYVFKTNKSYRALWNCQGKKLEKSYAIINDLTISACDLAARMPEKSPEEVKNLEIEGEFQILVASDIHGQFDLFIQLLRKHQIINQKNQWNFGTGHFVITGDVFDRGPQQIEALWFLYDLERQAEKSGGGVHLLLGNHEVMVLNGDLRYLHNKYKQTAQLFGKHYNELFKKDSVLGSWLRSLPVLININDHLFAHGGFHPKLARDNHSIESINTVFKSNLVKSEQMTPRSEFAKYLHKGNGPIWYRGYFNDTGATTQEIDILLKHFDVRKIIVGHTSQDTIQSRHDGKIIVVDAKLKNGKYGELLLIDKEQYQRLTLDGKVIPLFD